MRLAAAVVLALLVVPLRANVCFVRTFGYPLTAGRYLLVANANRDRIVCLTTEGTKVWERRVGHLLALDERDERSFLMQDGRNVYSVDAPSGALRNVGRVPRHEAVTSWPERRATWSFREPLSDHFAWLDPDTYRVLWRNHAVEHVLEVLPDRVIVSTASRVYEENGAFQWRDLAVCALDRETGRELWRVALPDSFPVEHAVSVGGVLIIGTGEPGHDSLLALDPAFGRIVKRLDGDYRSAARLDDEHIVAIRSVDGHDSLATLHVPDFVTADEMPAPAQENLILHLDGHVAVTQGIYSIAAFDLASKAKLWEIRHQMFPTPPSGGSMFAALARDDMAVLQRVDVGTGAEQTLYREPIPPVPASELRAEARARAALERSKRRKRAAEVRRRPRLGSEICLAFDHGMVTNIAQYLHLRASGEARYTNLGDSDSPPVSALGRWRRTGRDELELQLDDATYAKLQVGLANSVPLRTTLRITFEPYRTYLIAHFHDLHDTLRSNDLEELHSFIDAVLDSRSPIEPSAFRVIPCSELPAAVH